MDKKNKLGKGMSDHLKFTDNNKLFKIARYKYGVQTKPNINGWMIYRMLIEEKKQAQT